MNFTESENKKLLKIAKNKEKIYIVGVNGYGEPFTTIGRIGKSDVGQHAIFDDKIYVDFGKTKRPGSLNTEYFAAFHVSGEDVNYDWVVPYRFYIFEIYDENNNLIYINSDKKKIKNAALKNEKETFDYLKKENFYTDKKYDDNVSKIARKMIGRPVMIDNQKGILHSLKATTQNGYNVLQFISGPLILSSDIKEDSKLYTEDVNGEIIEIAENDFNESLDLINKRRNELLKNEEDIDEDIEK